MLITESKTLERTAHLTKLCSDMLLFCTHDYFPLIEPIVACLVTLCLEEEDSRSGQQWMEGFKMVHEINTGL
jgi:hypothetical protein